MMEDSGEADRAPPGIQDLGLEANQVDFGGVMDKEDGVVRSVLDDEADDGVPLKDNQEEVLDIDDDGDDDAQEEEARGKAAQARQPGVRRG